MTDTSAGTSTGGLPTPLFELHLELGGRLVDFGGHALPMRYEGTVAEHRATRAAAGLFDVSHMGIVELLPRDDAAGEDARGRVASELAPWLERCVPGSITNLAVGRMRYTQFTTTSGGVLDDLIVSNRGDRLRLVINAVRTDADLAMLRDVNGGSDVGEVRIELLDLALLALQGPGAAGMLRTLAPAAAELAFMSTASMTVAGIDCEVSRCGYTGEDGFEIAVRAAEAVRLARLLLGAGATPCGLGARDTLRLEAGLPLVGHELTEATTPAEAGLGWSIPKRRRAEASFPGADIITAQLANGPSRVRVGISAQGRRPIRDGAALFAFEGDGNRDGEGSGEGDRIGIVTSGGFGPTLDAPVAMAYVAATHAAPGTALFAQGRKGPEPCRVTALPFVEHRYWRP